MDKLTKKGLDGTQLKTIALVLMVLDHNSLETLRVNEEMLAVIIQF